MGSDYNPSRGNVSDLAVNTDAGIITQEGDTILGNTAGDQHQITGSLFVSAKLAVTGTTDFGQVSTDQHTITGSLAITDTLRVAGTVITPGSDVTGPATSKDNAIARYSGTDGKTLENSGVTIDDSDILTAVSGAILGTVAGQKVIVTGSVFVSQNLAVTGSSTFGQVSTDQHAITGSLSITDDVRVGGLIIDYVKGPSSATDNAIVKYDATTGKLVQNTGVTISDTDILTVPNGAIIGNTAGDKVIITGSLTISKNIAVTGSSEFGQVSTDQHAITGSLSITDDVRVGGLIIDYVKGPSSATDDAIVRFDATTGKLVQNSGVTISDTDILTVPNGAIIGNTAGDKVIITGSLTISSKLATTGSTEFGQATGDQHVFTGSLYSTNKLVIGTDNLQQHQITGAFNVTGVLGLSSFSSSSLPSPSPVGRLIFLANESGGATLVFSDGTVWRRVTDNAIVT